MPLQRIRVGWSGFIGGPGVSTFYALDAALAVPNLHAFFNSAAALLPVDVNIHVESSGDSLDVATGALTGSWSGDSSLAVIAGTDPSGYAAPTGMTCRWETDAVVGGHRLKGRTYLVPCGRDVFQADGTLTPDAISELTGWGNGLISATSDNMLVWQRPRLAAPAYTDRRGKVHPAITARVGAQAGMKSCVVPDKAAVLTSRRD